MGTYTTNYQLYMPSVGERGWGTLINDNYSAIDTAMKGLSNRLTAVENEVNGALSCTSVATSGTVTSSGIINANGGVTGGAITGTTITASTKFVGTLYGKVYVNAKTSTTKYNNDVQYATCGAQSLSTATTSSTLTVGGYSKISLSYPYQLYPGIFIPSNSYLTDSVPSTVSRTLTFNIVCTGGLTNSSSYTVYGYLYVNGTQVKSISKSYSSISAGTCATGTYTVKTGDSVYIQLNVYDRHKNYFQVTASIPAASNYYINVV